MKGQGRHERCVRLMGTIMLAALFLLLAVSGFAQEPPAEPGLVSQLLNQVDTAAAPDRISTTLLVFFLLTILAIAPAILVLTTSFTRIIVVMGFLRQAMATQQTPPNQVLIGLSLFLTFFIMTPTYRAVYEDAVAPYMKEDIGATDALNRGLAPIRDFMFNNTRPKDIALFLSIAGEDRPETRDDVSLVVLVPSFVISELRRAFIIGFVIYIPFLIIDMVVASTLMAMGMMMLPPVFVSLPFKIIMFVLADGWHLITRGLISGFNY